MIRSARNGVLICVALVAVGHAPLDTAERELKSAGNKADSAVNKVTNLKTTLNSIGDALVRIVRLLEDERQQRNRMLPLIDDAIRQSQSHIAEAEKLVTTRESELRKVQASLDTAKRAFTQHQRAIELTIAAERLSFAESERYRSAESIVQRRTSTVDKLTGELEAQLKENPTIVAAMKDVQDCELKLKQLRIDDPSNTTAIAQASDRWIASKSSLKKARDGIMAQHQPYVLAMDELRVAQQAVSAIKGDFESSLASRPLVIEARAACDGAEKMVRQWLQTAEDAKKAVDQAKSELDRSNSDIALLKRIKKESDSQLRQMQVAIGEVQKDLAAATLAATGAMADLAGIQNSLKSIGNAIDDAQKESKQK